MEDLLEEEEKLNMIQIKNSFDQNLQSQSHQSLLIDNQNNYEFLDQKFMDNQVKDNYQAVFNIKRNISQNINFYDPNNDPALLYNKQLRRNYIQSNNNRMQALSLNPFSSEFCEDIRFENSNGCNNVEQQKQQQQQKNHRMSEFKIMNNQQNYQIAQQYEFQDKYFQEFNQIKRTNIQKNDDQMIIQPSARKMQIGGVQKIFYDRQGGAFEIEQQDVKSNPGMIIKEYSNNNNSSNNNNQICQGSSLRINDFQNQIALVKEYSDFSSPRANRFLDQQNQNFNMSEEQDEFSTEKQVQIGCNCRKSKCLKLYCECFANQGFCNENCNCFDCRNKQFDAYQAEREKAIQDALSRNPEAFVPKQEQRKNEEVKKGCSCKKTKCLKKYCECYNSGLKCTSFCKCEDCSNGPKLVITIQNNPGQPQLQQASTTEEQEKDSEMMMFEENQIEQNQIGSIQVEMQLQQKQQQYQNVNLKLQQEKESNKQQLQQQQQQDVTKIHYLKQEAQQQKTQIFQKSFQQQNQYQHQQLQYQNQKHQDENVNPYDQQNKQKSFCQQQTQGKFKLEIGLNSNTNINGRNKNNMYNSNMTCNSNNNNLSLIDQKQFEKNNNFQQNQQQIQQQCQYIVSEQKERNININKNKYLP